MKKQFDLPVDDHLLQWAKKEIWEGFGPPYPIHEKLILGKLIYGLIIDKRTPKIHDHDDQQSVLSIELSDALAKRSPTLLKLSRTNDILDELFKIHLKTWVIAQMHNGSNRYQSIMNFFKEYGLDSEKLMSRYYRYLMRINSRNYRIAKENANGQTLEDQRASA